LALAGQAPEGNDALFQSLREANVSYVQALLAMADCMALMGSTPEEISNTLAFLQIGPDRSGVPSARVAQFGLGPRRHPRADQRRRPGRASSCAATPIASRTALQAVMNGSLLNWAIHRQGTLQAWIRRDLETVLAPYTIPAKSVRKRREFCERCHGVRRVREVPQARQVRRSVAPPAHRGTRRT
jgi:hypothetical protein